MKICCFCRGGSEAVGCEKRILLEIDEMLLNLLEVYEPLCVSRNGKLLLELPEEPIPKVLADPELCRQIFNHIAG